MPPDRPHPLPVIRFRPIRSPSFMPLYMNRFFKAPCLSIVQWIPYLYVCSNREHERITRILQTPCFTSVLQNISEVTPPFWNTNSYMGLQCEKIVHISNSCMGLQCAYLSMQCFFQYCNEHPCTLTNSRGCDNSFSNAYLVYFILFSVDLKLIYK
jgi:hypothetical protein